MTMESLPTILFSVVSEEELEWYQGDSISVDFTTGVVNTINSLDDSDFESITQIVALDGEIDITTEIVPP